MIRTSWKRSWVPALLIAITAVACDRSPVATEAGLEPSGGAEFAQGAAYQKVAGEIPVFDLEVVIGPEGDKIGVPGFYLVVPEGAVKAATTFEFASKNNGYIEMSLHATSLGSTKHNDVGSAGFGKPVQLWISGFKPKGGPTEWQKYKIGWVKDDGTIAPVRTAIHMASKTVVGYVPHFSDYALIFP